MQKFNKISVLHEDMDEKEAFFKIYSSLPLEEREKVVIVIDNEPISWNLAYQEIKNDTKRAHKILSILKKLEII